MRRGDDDAVQLDEADRGLCALLATDPRMTNRALGAEVGLSEETVAMRLRRLLEVGALAITAVVDLEAAGYRARAVARVRIDGGLSAREVLAPMLADDEVHSAAETVGCCDAVLWLIATDLDAVRGVVSRLRALSGVEAVTVDVVSELCRLESGGSTLPVERWSPRSLPAPVIALDDLDVRLVGELIVDGHESNREFARRLGVSDGTVRARLGRLADAGLVRVAAMVDPVRTGDVTSAAWVFLTMDGPDDSAVASLLVDPRVGTLDRCASSAGVVVLAVAEDPDELNVFISRDLRALPGVRSVETATVVEALRHQAHLVRL